MVQKSTTVGIIMAALDWNDVKVFLALYRGRSVRSASQELGMSHSTVSRHLTDLETSLGGVLFTRSRDGLLATGMAEQIFDRAERVEAEVLGFERQAANLDPVLSGEVRITAPPLLTQYMIMPMLAGFSNQYPEIEISLQSGNSIDDLLKGAADIALRSQFNPSDSLVGRKIPDFGDYAYASKDYIAGHNFDGDQTDATWIGRGLGNSENQWIKDSPFPNAKAHHKIPDPLDAAQAALAGMGMAALPCFFADQIEGLERIPGTGPLSFRPVWILTHPDLKTVVRVKTVAKFLFDEMMKHTAEISGH